MPEENTPAEGAEPKKPKFEPVHKFNHKGRNKSIPIFTASIEKGTNAGEIYLSPALDKIDYELIPEVWDPEVIMEESFRPELRKRALQFTRLATKKATINGILNEALMQEEYSKLLTNFTAATETRSGLVKQQKELLGELRILSMDLANKQPEFLEVAMKLAAIERQISDLKAKDEQVPEEPAASEEASS
jgi:hypothetical protein